MNSIFTYKGRIPTLGGGNYIPGFEMVTPGLTYGRWVASRAGSGTTTNRAAWSNDGISWTQATTPSILAMNSVDFSPELGLYVCVGSSGASNIISSTNGVTWTQRSKPDTVTLEGIAWSSAFNKWIAVGATKLYESSDGITWTILFTFSSVMGQSYNLEPFAGTTPDGDLFMTICHTGSTLNVVYTNDGTSFTHSSVAGAYSAGDGRSINYSPTHDTYLIFNQSTANRIPFSFTAGSGWSFYTQSQSVSGASRYGGAWGKDKFISPMFSGNTTTTPLQYSSTGAVGTWTASTFASGAYIFTDAHYSETLDQYIVFRVNSTNCWTSDDGITYTSRTMPAVEHNHGVFGPGIRTTGYKQGAGIT